MHVLSKPSSFWTTAYDDLGTLNDKVWVDVMVANFYLATIWYESQGDTAIHFVSHHFIQSLRFQGEDPISEEMTRFMHDYYIPLNHDCPLVPVAFLMHQNAHVFGVIFDYGIYTAYVLGR